MSRMHLSLAASAFLYLGAVLAGWAAAPLAAWPVFLGIFLMWSVLMRPEVWPREGARWIEAGVITRALMAVAVLAGLALACLALGWLLAGIVPLPPVGPWPGVLLALVGVGAARLVWNPAKSAEVGAVLDEALRQVQVQVVPPEVQKKRGEEAEIDSVIGFTADTPVDRIAEVMADLTLRFAPGRLVEGFQRQWKGGRMNAAQKRALILLATDPDQVRRIAGHEAGSLALLVCEGDAVLTEHFLRRYSALLDKVPDAMADGPANAVLREVERGFGEAPTAQMVRALREKQMRLARGGDAPLAEGAESP